MNSSAQWKRSLAQWWKRRRARRTHASWGMVQGLAVALLTLCLLAGTGVVRGWGNRTLDWWFSIRSVLPHDEEPASRVAILAIDRDT
ncbi:MAG TPA: hypothetical protein VM821_03570, partial [Abditibacteriaceae bacterium]|nr:hypothetical protein [Abditibacteriaceae bacterium]